jgi:hypothetical protein
MRNTMTDVQEATDAATANPDDPKTINAWVHVIDDVLMQAPHRLHRDIVQRLALNALSHGSDLNGARTMPDTVTVIEAKSYITNRFIRDFTRRAIGRRQQAIIDRFS